MNVHTRLFVLSFHFRIHPQTGSYMNTPEHYINYFIQWWLLLHHIKNYISHFIAVNVNYIFSLVYIHRYMCMMAIHSSISCYNDGCEHNIKCFMCYFESCKHPAVYFARRDTLTAVSDCSQRVPLSITEKKIENDYPKWKSNLLMPAD